MLKTLKKSLEHTLIVGTKFINDDYKLKKTIEDFGEFVKLNGFSNGNHRLWKRQKNILLNWNLSFIKNDKIAVI